VKSVSNWLTIRPPKIARPSGRRNSAPTPNDSISGTAAKSAANVVIRMGRSRNNAA
jgi:hypothetical protein